MAVPFDDLEDRLTAIKIDAHATVPLWTVLLAAHVKVLGMLTCEPAICSDVVPARDDHICLPFPITTKAATWRRLVAGVQAEEKWIWDHRYSLRDPLRAHSMHAIFEARSRTDALPPDQDAGEYGVRVVVADGHLRLRIADGVVASTHARRLVQMYRSVLEAMAADPDGDALASRLPVGERRKVLQTWSRGPSIDRGAMTVVDLIQAQAVATPQALAVETADARLTYRELDERSNRIAHHLTSLGACADTLVGVCLGRTADLVPALLGVWKAGAGYLPLDPALPAQRLRHMMDQTRCPLVVTTSSHLAALRQGTFVLLDEEHEAINAHPATPVQVHIDPAQLAYVIYTSGSTGEPKGVMVHHGGLVNYLLWTVGAYAAHGDGGAPVFSSISFDLGIPDIFTPLLTGQPTRLLPEPFDTADLGRHLAAGAPYSFIKMTPGHLDLLTHQLSAAQIRDLAGMVIAAGDSFSVALAARWHELAGPNGTRVATEYGPTEITIGNSGQPITDLPTTELVPLGTAIPNTTMYVLTDRLEPVPIGVPGEIYIGGAGVARGYLGRPDLTAERFVPDPYGPAGSRLYRSGDLARWLPDGTLDFLGRIDNQVKIRGYRVELGEIQASLGRHPQVRDAVVTAHESPTGDKRLIAYVVLPIGHALDPATLRAHLATTLPDYMIPAVFIAIDHIPLTTNGKLDGRALPTLL